VTNNDNSSLYGLNVAIEMTDCGRASSPANPDETKEVAIRQRITWLVFFGGAIAVTLLSYSAHLWATPTIGFQSIPLAFGTFDQF
jgi:hypothetical protein